MSASGSQMQSTVTEPPFRQQNFIWKTKAFDGCVPGDQAQAVVINAMVNAPIHVAGTYRIPIAPLLDQLRRITGNEDEADRCMQFVRDNIPAEYAAEIGRTGTDDANYIIIYPRANKPSDFRKSKTNTLTVVELVKVALATLQGEVKPYQTVNGIKITRSNLSTARDIAEVIRNELPNIKIMAFADKYTVAHLDKMIGQLKELKDKKDRENAISILKQNNFSEDQIAKILKA